MSYKYILKQFIKFGIVGFSNTVVGYAVYSALVYLKFYYFVASIISFCVGIGNAFFWNNKYVFKQNNDHRNNIKSLIKFAVTYSITGLVVQNILLYIFIDIFFVSKYIAPVFCLCVTVPSNFLLNKIWVFNTFSQNKGDS
jgi:putative flippase GtrA